MKLLREYRAEVAPLFWLFGVVFIIYLFIFGKFMLELFAGAFVFLYWTFMFAILLRHVREILMYFSGLIMKLKPTIKLKTLDPQCLPTRDINFVELFIFEATPIILIMVINIVVIIVSYSFYPEWYFTPVTLGTFLINFNVFYRNYTRIYIALLYKEDMFRYTPNTLKIFKIIEGYEPSKDLKVILRDSDLKFKRKMKA